MKKLGFTLAEVLVTLVIVGIIAAITVPSIMTNIKNHEHKSAYKKALSVLNQAITTEYMLEGNTTQNLTVLEIMKKRANVIKSGTGLWPGDSNNLNSAKELAHTFMTSDGFIYTVSDYATPAYDCDGNPIVTSPTSFSAHCDSGVVDINGEKGPNETSQYSKKINDQFYFKI